MYKRIVFPLVLLLACGYSAASVTEIEPDDSTAGAFPIPAADAAVGQMNSATDTDVYSITVDNANGSPIPIYFGCNVVIGDWMTEGVTESDESNWSVYYWGPGENPLPAIINGISAGTAAHSFVVGKTDCRQGLADIAGPFRFEINATTAGTYHIAVRGRFIGMRKVTDDDGTSRSVPAWIANSGSYSLRAIRTRTDGEMEPNDGMLEAYPLPSDSSVTAQLSSMYDEDWFSITTDGASAGRVTSVYMSCAAGTSGSNGANDPLFLVSAYDPSGTLQSSYQVGAARCTRSGGFRFGINTPAAGNYYVVVSAPTYAENARYSDLDYTLSQFFQVSNPGGGGGTSLATVRKALITDSALAAKDKVSVSLANCNTGGLGKMTLTGSGLDLTGLQETMAIKVQVGSWSCTTESTNFIKNADKPGKTLYSYPLP